MCIHSPSVVPVDWLSQVCILPHPPTPFICLLRQSLVWADSKSLKPGRSNNKKKGKPATFFLWTNININAMKNIHVKTTTMIIHLISKYSFFPLITPEKKRKKKKLRLRHIKWDPEWCFRASIASLLDCLWGLGGFIYTQRFWGPGQDFCEWEPHLGRQGRAEPGRDREKTQSCPPKDFALGLWEA